MANQEFQNTIDGRSATPTTPLPKPMGMTYGATYTLYFANNPTQL